MGCSSTKLIKNCYTILTQFLWKIKVKTFENNDAPRYRQFFPPPDLAFIHGQNIWVKILNLLLLVHSFDKIEHNFESTFLASENWSKLNFGNFSKTTYVDFGHCTNLYESTPYAWKQCAICFIFMRLEKRSFLMTQTHTDEKPCGRSFYSRVG